MKRKVTLFFENDQLVHIGLTEKGKKKNLFPVNSKENALTEVGNALSNALSAVDNATFNEEEGEDPEEPEAGPHPAAWSVPGTKEWNQVQEKPAETAWLVDLAEYQNYVEKWRLYEEGKLTEEPPSGYRVLLVKEPWHTGTFAHGVHAGEGRSAPDGVSKSSSEDKIVPIWTDSRGVPVPYDEAMEKAKAANEAKAADEPTVASIESVVVSTRPRDFSARPKLRTSEE